MTPCTSSSVQRDRPAPMILLSSHFFLALLPPHRRRSNFYCVTPSSGWGEVARITSTALSLPPCPDGDFTSLPSLFCRHFRRGLAFCHIMLQAFFLPVANSGEGEHVLHLLHGTAGRPALFTTFSLSFSFFTAFCPCRHWRRFTSTTPSLAQVGERTLRTSSSVHLDRPAPMATFCLHDAVQEASRLYSAVFLRFSGITRSGSQSYCVRHPSIRCVQSGRLSERKRC